MGYAHAHIPSMAGTYIELVRGSWASGCVWKVMTDCASKWFDEKQRGTVLGSEATSLASCKMTYNRPQVDSPESKDHVYTSQSCHGAVAAPLFEVLQEGSLVSSLFPLTKLHVVSHPLAGTVTTVARRFYLKHVVSIYFLKENLNASRPSSMRSA